MDPELCDLIMILYSKDKMQNLQQKITDFYTYDNFHVNDPKSVSGGKRIDIEEHSTKDNKEVKLKFLTIYFYTKENKVMIQGSDINLEIFIKNYLYQFTRSLHINDFVSTNDKSEQFSNELDTIDSSQVVPSNANEVYVIPETNDNISEFSDGSLSIITETGIRPEILTKKILLKIEELVKAQNENHKDLETQYQNKARLQIKEFEDELIKQQETFNIELEFVRTEIKKLPKECTDLRGQLKQAQKQISSIDNQLKPSPPTFSVKQMTSSELHKSTASWAPLPNSFTPLMKTSHRILINPQRTIILDSNPLIFRKALLFQNMETDFLHWYLWTVKQKI